MLLEFFKSLNKFKGWLKDNFKIRGCQQNDQSCGLITDECNQAGKVKFIQHDLFVSIFHVYCIRFYAGNKCEFVCAI